MPIPNRTTAADYHYYAYMYPGDNVAGPWGLSPAQPNRRNYQFYSLEQDLTELQATGLANNVPNIGLLQAGAAINADGNIYHTLALAFGNSNNVPNCPTVLLTGGIHAREWIAPAITFLIAEYLIKNYSQNPDGPYQTALSYLINTRNIYIVPMLNPAGNWHSVFSANANARMWRKNCRLLPNTQPGWQEAINHAPFQNFQNGPGANQVQYRVPRYNTEPLDYDTITIDFTNQLIGVDGNRNFNTPAWGHEPKYNDEGQPAEESYFGINGNSEYETQNLALLVNSENLVASIDYHSFSQLILYPTEAALGQQGTFLGQALQTLIASCLNPSWLRAYDYKLGTAMELLNYNAVSSVADYMASVNNSRAYTIELDPRQDDPGFELPENCIMSVFEKNIRGALGLIAAAGNNLNVSAGNWYTRHTIMTTSVAGFANWNVFGRGNQLPLE